MRILQNFIRRFAEDRWRRAAQATPMTVQPHAVLYTINSIALE